MPFKVILKYVMTFIGGGFFALLLQSGYSNFVTYKTDETRIMLKEIKDKILDFEKKCGYLPSAQQGLMALVDPSIQGCSAKGLLPVIPIDSWGGNFVYIPHKSHAFLLSSTPEGSFIQIR